MHVTSLIHRQIKIYRRVAYLMCLIFREYVEFPASLGEKFDVILDDGRARVAAAESAIRYDNRYTIFGNSPFRNIAP